MLRRAIQWIGPMALAAALSACAGAPSTPAAGGLAPTAGGPAPTLVQAATLPPAAVDAQPIVPASPTPTPTAPPTPQVITLKPPYGPASMGILVRINDWRVGLGLWPLKVNNRLTELAQAQADYLASLPTFPDDPHAGPTGKDPKQRALAAGWPTYNSPDQIAVDEVAYTGASPASAVTWWKGSPIHARTLTQIAYREIGVADADKGHGHVFVGVVGSRPDEIPVLLDPAKGTWYISSEQYRWAHGDRLQAVTRFAFLSDAGLAASASPPAVGVAQSMWQVYALTVPAGDLAGAQAVALGDGPHTVVRPLSLAEDIAWLSSDVSTATITLIDKPAPTVGGATPQPTAEAAAPVPPTATPSPAEPSNPNLTLIYGPVSMTLWHNPPGGPLDLSGVVLRTADDQISTHDFEGPWLGVPLKTFSVGSCLQTWPMSASQSDPGAVPGCYVRASVINLKAKSKFWLKAPFDVLNNGALLRTCPVGPATCGVELP